MSDVQIIWSRNNGAYEAEANNMKARVYRDGRYWSFSVTHCGTEQADSFAAAKRFAEYQLTH